MPSTPAAPMLMGLLAGAALTCGLYFAFRLIARAVVRRTLTAPRHQVAAPRKVTPALLVAALLWPLPHFATARSGESTAVALGFLGGLLVIGAWGLHRLPGHQRNLKYGLFLLGSSLVTGVPQANASRGSELAPVVGVLAWVIVLVSAAACIVLLRPDEPFIAAEASSARALRTYRVVTAVQGSDLVSALAMLAMSALMLSPAYLFARWCAKARLSRRAVVYLRSFHYEDAGRVFGQVVTPGLFRSAPATGLVHTKQPADTFLRHVPLLWRSDLAAISDENWQAWVNGHVRDALAVVIDVSVSTGSVSWELERARSLLRPGQILVMHRADVEAAPEPGVTQLSYDLRSKVDIEAARARIAEWFSRALSSAGSARAPRPLASRPRFQFSVPLLLAAMFGVPTALAWSTFGEYQGLARQAAREPLERVVREAEVLYLVKARCPTLDELQRVLPDVPMMNVRLECPEMVARSAGRDGRFGTDDDVVVTSSGLRSR